MKISNFKFQISKLPSGFTLVELLVVIGVLGVLAAGLLATVDPLEQFRKAADSNRRSTSLELINALTRYYAAKQALPWDSVANGGDACNAAALPNGTSASGVAAATAFGDCFTALSNLGEIKTTFASQYQILNKLVVTETTPAGSTDRRVAVCFNPESKSMSSSGETIYSNLGVASAACDTAAERQAAGAACFYCAQ
jgi:prepilin-type N-terminal cleavage/methylation domain-containing protein